MALRKLLEDDLEMVLEWRNDPAVRSNMFCQDVIDIKSHRIWFEKQSKKEDSEWLMYVNEKNQPSGVVYFTDIDNKAGNAYWGIYLAPDAVAGTGTKVGFEALDYFFENKELHKLCAEVLEKNERSKYFHKKLGFSVEGLLREQYRNGGSYQHVIRFGLIADEWAVHRQIFSARMR